jgi:membrane-associated phospholipid phosphatase
MFSGMERRRIAAGLGVSAAVLCARARRRLGLGPALATAGLFLGPVSVAALPGSRYGDAAVWTAQMLAYKNAFEMPNDDPARLQARAHVDYPVAIDSRLGGGIPLGQRLQRRLRRRGHLSLLDKAMTFFYWTWELEPHAVMAWIRWRHPERFPAAAGRLAAVFDLTLVGYWALPTAPPWWASEEAGRMQGQVRRVMDEVAEWVQRKPNPTDGNHELGANPFAAMPSDHLATAAMTAILVSEIDPALGALAWGYALLLAFALLYLGEHYVTDLLAGLTLTLTVAAARPALERAAGAILALG